jgi:tRNA1(Val) A37 N6-methylase TrmN6
MNPPFNDPDRQNLSPDPRRRLAHAARLPLDIWVGRATRLLAPHGVLTLIWRADGLAEVLAALGAAGYGAMAVLPVHPRPDAPAIRILVACEKGSAVPLVVLPGLVLNDEFGRPTEAAEAILRQGASLPLAAVPRI